MPLKSPDRQDLKIPLRVRQSRVKQRTAVANQTRGLLGEFGIVTGQGLNQVRKRLPEIEGGCREWIERLKLARCFRTVTTGWLSRAA
jgi:transposase